MAEKQEIKLNIKFYQLDGGNQNMLQFAEVTCPNPACANTEQGMVWQNDSSDSLRSLICPKCGKKLYSVVEKDDENGGRPSSG